MNVIANNIEPNVPILPLTEVAENLIKASLGEYTQNLSACTPQVRGIARVVCSPMRCYPPTSPNCTLMGNPCYHRASRCRSQMATQAPITSNRFLKWSR